MLGSSVGDRKYVGLSGRVTFVLGAATGGLLLGVLMYVGAALVNQFPAGGWLLVVFLVLIALAGLFGKRLPLGLKRQVNHSDIIGREPALALVNWGLQLGFGFVTYPGTALLAAYVTASVLVLTPSGAILAGFFYGLTRGVTILMVSRMDEQLDIRRLAEGSEGVAWVFSAALALFALASI